MATPSLATASLSSAASPALHDYARARLADGDGALAKAADGYRAALTRDPGSVDVARRAYYQAMESGDMALALRSARLLEAAGLLPRDGALLLIGDALARSDWPGARQWTDRLVEQGNFAFMAPMIRGWIILGEGGGYMPPVLDPTDRMAPLASRFIAEQVALQWLAQGNVTSARPDMARAQTGQAEDISIMRLTFAGALARTDRAAALAMLPMNGAVYARARADIEAGRVRGMDVIAPAQGYARLLARLADDIGGEPGTLELGVRLARIASFADPAGAGPRIIAARLLTRVGLGEYAAAELAKISDASWFRTLADIELVDALAAQGEDAAALALARRLAAMPDAEGERQVRLGRLLAKAGDFAGAASAFRAAQAAYAPGDPPWPLLLYEGSALEQAGRWPEARAVLQRATRIAPGEPVVLNYLGYAQVERRENVEEALAMLQKASRLKPDDPSITDSFGWARFVSGDVEGAVPVLERAAAGAPQDVTVNEHLGDALWAAGRRYEARYAWEAAAFFAEGKVADRLEAKKREGFKPQYAAP